MKCVRCHTDILEDNRRFCDEICFSIYENAKRFLMRKCGHSLGRPLTDEEVNDWFIHRPEWATGDVVLYPERYDMMELRRRGHSYDEIAQCFHKDVLTVISIIDGVV